MSTPILILVLSGIYLVISLAVIGAVLIVASKRIKERDLKIKEATKLAKHNQELLDAYGIKEIKIKKEEE